MISGKAAIRRGKATEWSTPADCSTPTKPLAVCFASTGAARGTEKLRESIGSAANAAMARSTSPLESSDRGRVPSRIVADLYATLDPQANEKVTLTGSLNVRAIAFQNSARRQERYASFHPARLNLPRKEPFDPSFCIAFSAMWRRTARLCGPFPHRVLSWSSFIVTSRRQCRLFSTPQCDRATSFKRAGDRFVLNR